MKELILTDWTDRLIEYSWLCLIHDYYGRTESFIRYNNIVEEWVGNGLVTDFPYISKILSMNKNEQEKVWSIVAKYIDKEVLAPIIPKIKDIGDSCIITQKFGQPFLSSLYCTEKVRGICEKYVSYHSNEATDIVYLGMLSKLKSMNSIKIPPGFIIRDALQNYIYTKHTDTVIMPKYRSSIRAFEQTLLQI